jgi:hypothetical protein
LARGSCAKVLIQFRMILKFILLGSVCLSTPDTGTKCTQYMVDDLIYGPGCRSKAKQIGIRMKDQVEEIGGSMASYDVHCIAIDNKGYNVDYSFQNIL